MRFGHPKMLWLLAFTLPLLSGFLWWSWRKRQFLVSQFVRSRLLAHLTVGLSKTIQKTRMALLVVSVGLLLLALAQPQWGFAWEEARQRGLDIVVAIDTSRSMLAEDIVPNRLQRAKLAALDLMRLARHDRLGLVAFAGTAFLQCPLTLDDEAFRQSLNQLEVGIIPQGGTALAEAIRAALTAFKEDVDNHRVLVLFTDGEDHDTGAADEAKQAAERGLRIFTVGVGTANGELLRQRDEHGNLTYVKDEQGNVVKSRLNDSLLREIATAAHGFYLPLRGTDTAQVLYERGLGPLPKGESSTKLIKQFRERYQWPLAMAILVLIAELFLPDRKRVRKTEAIMAASNPELRKMVASAAILLLAAAQVLASPSSALRKYESGRYRDAYQEYERLLKSRPEDVRLQYNAGAAAYQARRFDEAVQHFSAAATAPDLKLQERAYYNLGNSLYRVGEEAPVPDKKAQSWEESARQFEAALKLDPKDVDARFNLDFVKKQLEELKRQQQKQKQHKNKNDQKKDEEKNQDQRDQQQDQSKSNDSQSKPDEEKKQDAQSHEQPKHDQKEKQEQQEQANSQENKDQQANKGNQDKNDTASAQSGDKRDDKPQAEGAESASTVPVGQMTPEQVKQLLDSQKNNEKTMIFLPREKKARKHPFKDW